MRMKKRIDYILQTIQLYSYLLPTKKIGNAIMDFRKKYTLCSKSGGGRMTREDEP